MLQEVLKAPLDGAQALLKGWLFYRRDDAPPTAQLGVTPDHCRGWWCTLDELDAHAGPCLLTLPRLAWLPPAMAKPGAEIARASLASQLAAQFEGDSMPVLVASVEERDGWLVEVERGFVVPNDWQQRAQRRLPAPAPS